MPRTRRKRGFLRWTLSLAAVVMLAAVLTVVLKIPLPMRWLVPFIEERASVAAGEPVRIRGALRLTPGLVSTVTCTDLEIGTGDPDDGRLKAVVGMATVAIKIWPLRRGQFHIQKFDAAEIRIRLPASDAQDEEPVDADAVHVEASPAAPALPRIAIDRFEVRDVAIVGTDAPATDEPIFTLHSLIGSLPADGDLALDGSIHLGTVPIDFRGVGGTLADFISESNAWPVHVEAQVEDSTVSLTGQVEKSEEGRQLQASVSIEMGTPDMLQTYISIALGAFTPLSLELNLVANSGALRLSDLRGRAGGIDLALDLDADWGEDGLGLDCTADLGPVDVQALAESINADWNIPVRLGHGRLEFLSRGASLREHLQSLSASALVEDCTWNPSEGQSVVSIQNGTVEVRPGQATDIGIQGSVIGEDVTVIASVNHPSDILMSRTTPLDVNISKDGAVIEINGTARRMGEGLDADFHLAWQTEDIADISAWSGIAPDAPLPFHAWADVALRGDSGVVHLDRVNLGQSDLSGSITWTNRADRIQLSTSVASDRLDLKELALLKAAGMDVRAESSRPDSESDVSFVTMLAGLPPIDVDATIGHLTGSRLNLEDVHLEGKSDGDSLLRAAIKFNLRDAAFGGNFVADWSGDEPTVHVAADGADVEIGTLLEDLGIVEGLNLTLASLRFDASARGNNLEEILEESEFTLGVSDVQLYIPHPAQERTLTLDLERVSLNAPHHELLINASGTFEDRRIELTLESDDVHLGRAHPVLPVRLGIVSDGHELQLQSRLNLPLRKPPWDLQFSLRGQDLSGLVRPDEPRLPDIGPYDLSGRLRISDNGISVDDVVFQLASSLLRGDFALERREARPYFTVDLAAETLQLAEFKKDSDEDGAPSAAEEDLHGDEDSPKPGPVERVLREVLRNYDGRFTLDAAEVLSGEDRLGAGNFDAELGDGALTVSRCTLELEGGVIDLGLRYDLREEDANIAFTAHVIDFEYGIAARRLDAKAAASGRLDLDLELAAEAPSLRNLLHYADGTIRFSIWPANLDASIFDLWASNLILNVIPVLNLTGGSVVNCVAGDIDMQKGIMHPHGLLIDSTRVQVNGKGRISLPHDRIKLDLKPRPKSPKFLSLSTPIAIEGPLKNPRIAVSAGGIAKTLIRLYYSVIIFPWEWLTQQRIPEDNSCLCRDLAGVSEVGVEGASP